MKKTKTQNARRRRLLSALALVAVGLAGLAVAAVILARQWAPYRAAKNEYEALRSRYGVAQGAAPAPVADVPALQLANEDCVGWLQIPDTGIDYPVVQAADNDYYLRRTFRGAPNIAGAIFMDYRCPADFAGGVTILYGHNMRDGSMFSPLSTYLSEGYLAAHSAITVHTAEETLAYRALAAMQVPSNDALYALPGQAAPAGDLLGQLGPAAEGCTEDDRFLILSTCTDEGGEEERYVLVAVLEEAQ